jgi:hypothetical protein
VPDWLYYPLVVILGVGLLVLLVWLMQGWRH